MTTTRLFYIVHRLTVGLDSQTHQLRTQDHFSGTEQSLMLSWLDRFRFATHEHSRDRHSRQLHKNFGRNKTTDLK